MAPLIELINYTPTLTGGVTINTSPGLAQIPASNQQGQLDTVNAGQIFPTLKGNNFMNISNVNGMPYVPQSGVLDPRSPNFQQQIDDYSLYSYLSSNNLAGIADDGCLFNVEIYGNIWNFDPNYPYECKSKFYYNSGVLLYTGSGISASNLPIFASQTVCQTNPGVSCYGKCDTAQYLANPAAYLYVGPGFQYLDGLGYRITGQSCGGGPYTPLMPIPVPPPITIPTQVPVPTVTPAQPAPTILNGTVTDAPPGMAGSITFSPTPNGALLPSIALPNCSCSNGVTPTFKVRNVTANPKLPLTVTLVNTGGSAYVFDFNIPPGTLPFLELPLQIPMINPVTNQEALQSVSVWAPTDGTNDMRGFMGLVLEQILELRANISVAPTTSQGIVATST